MDLRVSLPEKLPRPPTESGPQKQTYIHLHIHVVHVIHVTHVFMTLCVSDEGIIRKYACMYVRMYVGVYIHILYIHIHTYVYCIHIHTYIYIYIYIYIYREREREREREVLIQCSLLFGSLVFSGLLL